MKVACTSVGGQQLALNNVALPYGWKYFEPYDYVEMAAYAPDVLWLGGFPCRSHTEWQLHRVIVGEIPNVILQWFGSDILACRQFKERGEDAIFDWLNTDRFVHVPPSDEADIEIETLLGVKTCGKAMDVPAQKIRPILPPNEDFKIGVYMPPHRMPFYHFKEISKAMGEMPKIKAIYYHWLPQIAEIKPDGRSELRYGQTQEQYEKTLADCSCLLRVPQHDAVSISAAEFLMSGKPVISNQNLPHWKTLVKGDVTAEKIVKAIKKTQRNGTVPIETSDYYRDRYDPAKYKERLEEAARTKWPGFRFG